MDIFGDYLHLEFTSDRCLPSAGVFVGGFIDITVRVAVRGTMSETKGDKVSHMIQGKPMELKITDNRDNEL